MSEWPNCAARVFTEEHFGLDVNESQDGAFCSFNLERNLSLRVLRSLR
jgi:hypothetical protein